MLTVFSKTRVPLANLAKGTRKRRNCPDGSGSAGLLLTFFRRLRFLAQVLARLLVDQLHGEAHLAAIVEAKQLHLHRVAFLDDIGDLADATRREFGNVNETVLRPKEIHEGAEIHHLDHLAVIDFADLRLGDDGLDPFERCANGLAVGGGDLHGPVVLDVDLGARLLHDFADHLAAGTDHFADLVGRNVNYFDARRMLAELVASAGYRVAHLAQNMQAAFARLIERDTHDLLRDAGDLDVHLERGDTLFRAGDLEVHVAKMVLISQD